MDYSDIINLPHHVSSRHKQMSLLNRAAQFAPFAALSGHEDAIEECARATDDAIELSDDLANQLDQQLSRLYQAFCANPSEPVNVNVTYFLPDFRKSGGKYNTVNACVKAIDNVARQIILSDGRTLKIENIVSLSVV